MGEALALRGDDLELRLGDGELLGPRAEGLIAGERLEAVPDLIEVGEAHARGLDPEPARTIQHATIGEAVGMRHAARRGQAYRGDKQRERELH